MRKNESGLKSKIYNKTINFKGITKEDIISDYYKTSEDKRIKRSINTMHKNSKSKDSREMSFHIQKRFSSSKKATPNILSTHTATKSTTKRYIEKIKQEEPVLIITESSKLSKNLSTSLNSLRVNDPNLIKNSLNFLTDELNTLYSDRNNNNNSESINDNILPKIEKMMSKFSQKLSTIQNEKRELENEIEKIKHEFENYKKDSQKEKKNLERERDDYKEKSNKYMEISRQLGEDVIILRSQLDKFLHFKKAV